MYLVLEREGNSSEYFREETLEGATDLAQSLSNSRGVECGVVRVMGETIFTPQPEDPYKLYGHHPSDFM